MHPAWAAHQSPPRCVHVSAHPVQKRFEVALSHLFIDAANILLSGLKQLRGVEVSESVGGEVTEGTEGPVNVL